MSSLTSPPSWHIQPVTPATINETVTFINNARRAMFPKLCAQLNDDVARWVLSGHFLIARDGEEMIATIGYVPYDHRFPRLDYKNVKTVEVVRLYVLPQYRRCGLAAKLFAELRRRAVDDGVACLYLHTHPFLPGAIAFWEKQGFVVTCTEEDEVWQTTHMEVVVGGVAP